MDEYCGYDVEDVHSGTELDEVMCEVCGMIQPATNKVCSHCGEDFKKGKARNISINERKLSREYTRFITFVITIVAFLTLHFVTEAIENHKEKDNDGKIIIEIPENSKTGGSIPKNLFPNIPKSEVKDNQKSEESATDGDEIYPMGEYVVGEDIPEGEYIAISDNFGNNDIEDSPYIIVNDGEMNHSIYFFNSYYDYFETGYILEMNGCTIYPVGSCPVDNTPFENYGMFKVGVDVKAGEYNVVPLDDKSDCPYWIYDIDYPMCTQIESGEVSESGAVIELKDGQYLLLFFCRLEEIE